MYAVMSLAKRQPRCTSLRHSSQRNAFTRGCNFEPAMPPRSRSPAKAKAAPPADDGEFAGRDASGLQDKKGKVVDEATERSHYLSLFGKLIFLQAPLLAWTLYAVGVYVLPGGDAITRKLMVVHDNTLEPVFVVWFLTYLTRACESEASNSSATCHAAPCLRETLPRTSDHPRNPRCNHQRGRRAAACPTRPSRPAHLQDHGRERPARRRAVRADGDDGCGRPLQ